MIIRCAYDNDVVIHLNNKKGMKKDVQLSDGSIIELIYPNTKEYFLRVNDKIVKKSDNYKTIEDEYIKECESRKDSDDHGRIDVALHKLVDNKVALI